MNQLVSIGGYNEKNTSSAIPLAHYLCMSALKVSVYKIEYNFCDRFLDSESIMVAVNGLVVIFLVGFVKSQGWKCKSRLNANFISAKNGHKERVFLC